VGSIFRPGRLLVVHILLDGLYLDNK
jgi:hypothetical protein